VIDKEVGDFLFAKRSSRFLEFPLGAGFASGADVIEYVPAGSIDRVLSIASHHSGMTPAEMRVPLILI
jgi:hypothetical protein